MRNKYILYYGDWPNVEEVLWAVDTVEEATNLCHLHNEAFIALFLEHNLPIEKYIRRYLPSGWYLYTPWDIQNFPAYPLTREDIDVDPKESEDYVYLTGEDIDFESLSLNFIEQLALLCRGDYVLKYEAVNLVNAFS